MKNRSGMTLIEVLLAVVILGFSVAALMTAASQCMAVARKARLYETTRELIARVELVKPIRLEKNIEDAAGSGSFEEQEFSAYRWERTVELVGAEEDALYKVSTFIHWSENGKDAKEDYVTYIFWPEALEGGTVTTPAGGAR